MRCLVLHSIALGILCPALCFSQENEPDIQQLEDAASSIIVEESDEEENSESPITLDVFPMDIHSSDLFLLLEANWISIEQWTELQNHILLHGRLIDLAELQCIPSWDLPTIKKIRSVLFVPDNSQGNKNLLKNARHHGKHTLNLYFARNRKKSKGFLQDELNDRVYLGPNFRNSMYYRFDYQNKLRIGISAERDVGEPFKVEKPFDSFNAYFSIRDPLNRVKNIIIGDFRISMGQGLIAHSGFSSGISGNVLGSAKGGRSLRVHSGHAEFGFRRGISFIVEPIKNIEITTFFFKQKLDANLNDSVSFSSIQKSGLHRSEIELVRKQSLGFKGLGGSLSWRKGKNTLAINHLSQEFELSYSPQANKYTEFRVYGTVNHFTSLSHSWTYKNFHFFGEIALQNKDALAILQGVQIGLGKGWLSTIIARKYSPGYYNPDGNAFGIKSGSTNESGVYIAIDGQLSSRWRANFYFDMHSLPWLSYSSDWGSNGILLGGSLHWLVKREWEVSIFFKHKSFEDLSLNEKGPFKSLISSHTNRYKLFIRRYLSKGVEWRIRSELKTTEQSQGFLLATDLIWQPIERKISFTSRYALFDSPNYSTRIYVYENDLTYRGRSRAYYGRGQKIYLNLRYRPVLWLSLEGRVALTRFADRTSFGSGNDEVIGNELWEYGVQVRVKW